MRRIIFPFQLCIVSMLLFFEQAARSQQTVGLFAQSATAQDGYVLFAPNFGNTTYLIDKCGYQVHSWSSTHQPGQSVYLLEDGSLLRTGRIPNSIFNAGGLGGIIEKFDWNSNLIWSYVLSSGAECQHHDIKILPNGNVLAISYELKTIAEAISEGSDPIGLGTSVWSDKIVEIQPTGPTTGIVVWEWHAWDHLVQDFDNSQENYGVVADHPELIDINYNLGTQSDWLHCNAIDYNAQLDQIILSAHNQNEFWIIDHSTSTEQSASHSGGNHGRGGDLLYRWGNPEAYDRGTIADKKLFGQHNPHWIEAGLPDEGNILLYNNGVQRPEGNFSTVEILAPPIAENGDYFIEANAPFLPDSSYWKYEAPVPTDFFSQNISGAQRLSNGNTIICEGMDGDFFEINSSNQIVWRYVNPVGQNGNIISQGTNPTQNSVFRCTLLQSDYSGLSGQTLTPGNPIELNPLPYECNTSSQVDELTFVQQQIEVLNPFTDFITLKANSGVSNAKMYLYDLAGRCIQQENNINISEGNTFKIATTESYTTGIYLLQITGENTNFTTRLIHLN